MSARSQMIRSAVAGTVAGIGAFLVGYLVTYLYVGRDVEETLEPLEMLLSFVEAEPVGTWRVVGWMHYGAHFVETRISTQFGPIESTATLDLVGGGAGELEVLYLVPPLLLLVAGALVAAYRGSASVGDGAIGGMTVALGYALCVLAGLVVFAYSGSRPAPIPAILLAGVLYPVVFGAVGGAITAQLRTIRTA